MDQEHIFNPWMLWDVVRVLLRVDSVGEGDSGVGGGVDVEKYFSAYTFDTMVPNGPLKSFPHSEIKIKFYSKGVVITNIE